MGVALCDIAPELSQRRQELSREAKDENDLSVVVCRAFGPQTWSSRNAGAFRLGKTNRSVRARVFSSTATLAA